MSEPHGSTAPSSMDMLSSGTSEASSTVRTTPVPPHVVHAPPLLKARSSAPGPMNSAPQTGQRVARPRATSMEGGTRCPLGQTWLPRREKRSRR